MGREKRKKGRVGKREKEREDIRREGGRKKEREKWGEKEFCSVFM